MKIILNKSVKYERKWYPPDSEVSWPADITKGLVAKGHAEEVTSRRANKAEKAAEKAEKASGQKDWS